ncbi:MAG TPA: helix-turn-helix domain-containing protein [Candidatus Paceibacterota bacterium]|nr:helix-turn-helix domain-containing protein [Candidatus Paceibacterota bacterium]
MIQLEYTKEITDTGLSKEQAIVYEVLLKLGESPASAIAKSIPSGTTLSRPLVYKVLEELIGLDLASKSDETGKIAKFTPKHPVAITKVIEEQKEKIERIKKQFLVTSGKLSSLFNLSVGKPGVQFYEGEDGVWEVLLDSLTASEEILTYADLEAIAKYIPELNAEYSAIREDTNVKKRGLVIDSPAARKFLRSYDGDTTHTKLISASANLIPFQTDVQIYDNKVSYITLTDEYLVGIIITDQFIANTHKYLFESLWELSSGEIV